MLVDVASVKVKVRSSLSAVSGQPSSLARGSQSGSQAVLMCFNVPVNLKVQLEYAFPVEVSEVQPPRVEREHGRM